MSTTSPAPTPAPVQFHVTPRMSAAFLRCKQQIDQDQRTDEYRTLQNIFQQSNSTPATPQLITLPQLQSLSRLYRSTLPTPPPLPPRPSLSSSSSGLNSPRSPKPAAAPTKPLLFGSPLADAIRRNAPHPLPKVCQDCMVYLRAQGLQEPGLFRVAGNKIAIGVLKDQYDAEFVHEDGSHPVTPFTDVHDASGVFKLYFRSLPEPIIPFELYDRFIKVGNTKGGDPAEQLSPLVKQLPKDNLTVLSSLFHFLLEVSRYSTVNKMTPDNLAIVFAPNLLRPKVETPKTMMNDMAGSISVIATLIANYEQIFDESTRSAAAALATASSTPRRPTLDRKQSEEEFFRQLSPRSKPVAKSKATPTKSVPDESATIPTPAAVIEPVTEEKDDDSPGEGWVHELVQGSSIYIAPLPRSRPPRDPAFLKYLEEQRWKQERREYHQLVKDLPGNKNLDGQGDETIGKGFAGASRDIGHGLNILTLMATGFIVFYYVGTSLFPNNQVMAIMSGLLGLIGALFVEVGLFLVREQKSVMETEQQQKMRNAAKLKERQFDKQITSTGKKQSELERRRLMFEAQNAALVQDAAANEEKLD